MRTPTWGMEKWVLAYKNGIISKTVITECKLLITACIKSSMHFQLPPKYMTLNDLLMTLEIIDNAQC